MAIARSVRQAGYPVAVCPGPSESERCPLAGPEGCAVAHGADVIVSSLGLRNPASREALQALRMRCPETPVIVEVSPGEEAEWSDLLEGCEPIASTVAPEQLVAAIREALARRSS